MAVETDTAVTLLSQGIRKAGVGNNSPGRSEATLVSDESDDDLDPDERKARDEMYRLDCARFRGVRAEVEHASEFDLWHPWHVFGHHFISIVILLNCVFLGVASGQKEPWMIVMEHFFTAVFFVEMCVLFWHEGFLGYFADSWRRLDFVLCWLAMFDNWFLAAVPKATLSSFMVLKILRLLRVLKLLRIIQVKKELNMLVKGMVAAIRAMSWIMVLLAIVVYSASLIMKSLVDKSAFVDTTFDAQARFRSVGTGMLTMLNVLILEEWSDIVWPMYEKQWYLLPFFIAYLMFTTFGIMNVVIGVVTEQAMTMSNHYREMHLENKRRVRMRKIMKIADTIFAIKEEMTARDLERIAVNNEELMSELRAIELPRGFMLRDLHLVFDTEYSASLSKDEFINGMFRIVFNDDFQRHCCVELAIAQLRSQMHGAFRRQTRELVKAIRLHGEVPLQSSAEDARRSAALAEEESPYMEEPGEEEPTPPPEEVAPSEDEPAAGKTHPLLELLGATMPQSHAADAGRGQVAALADALRALEASLRQSEDRYLTEMQSLRAEASRELAEPLERLLVECSASEAALARLRAWRAAAPREAPRSVGSPMRERPRSRSPAPAREGSGQRSGDGQFMEHFPYLAKAVAKGGQHLPVRTVQEEAPGSEKCWQF